MTRNYIIRPYHPDDEEEIVELLELVFNVWPHFDLNCLPLDYWRWKFFDNPLNLIIIAVVDFEGRIIGCWHRIPQKVKFGNTIIFASQGADVAVHPDFQGRGLSSKLRDLTYDICMENNVSFSLGTNMNPKLRKSARARGYKDIAPLLAMIKIDDVNLHFNMMKDKHDFIKKYGYYMFKMINKVNKLKVFHKHEPVKCFNIINNNKFDSKIDDFWGEMEKEFNFIVIKNREYLNWRYCDPRGGKYVIKQVVYDDHVLGYSVLRINEYIKDYPIGYIVDLLALPQRYDVAEALIKDALLYFDIMNVNSIHCWQFQNEYYKLFINHSFINTNRIFLKYNFIDTNLSLPDSSLFSLEKLHFALGDSDWI